jgi:hypothetical protein
MGLFAEEPWEKSCRTRPPSRTLAFDPRAITRSDERVPARTSGPERISREQARLLPLSTFGAGASKIGAGIARAGRCRRRLWAVESDRRRVGTVRSADAARAAWSLDVVKVGEDLVGGDAAADLRGPDVDDDPSIGSGKSHQDHGPALEGRAICRGG